MQETQFTYIAEQQNIEQITFCVSIQGKIVDCESEVVRIQKNANKNEKNNEKVL